MSYQAYWQAHPHFSQEYVATLHSVYPLFHELLSFCQATCVLYKQRGDGVPSLWSDTFAWPWVPILTQRTGMNIQEHEAELLQWLQNVHSSCFTMGMNAAKLCAPQCEMTHFCNKIVVKLIKNSSWWPDPIKIQNIWQNFRTIPFTM